MCAPQWRRYFPIYENDKHYHVSVRGGLTLFTQELLTVCRRKRGGTCSRPPDARFPLLRAPRGRQRPVSSVTSHLFSRLSGPSWGPLPFSVELEILSLVFSLLFHPVWGVVCTDCDVLPRRPAPLHRSPAFVPHHATCHSCGVNKEH